MAEEDHYAGRKSNTIVHAVKGLHVLSPGVVVSGGAGKEDFDRVSVRLFGRYATSEALHSAFKRGAAGGTAGVAPYSMTLGNNMICEGPSDVEALPGGYFSFSVNWSGFLDSGTRMRYSQFRGIREMSLENVRGVPNAGNAAVKVILHEQTAGVRVWSLHFGKTAPSPPDTGKTGLPQGVTITSPPGQFKLSGSGTPVFQYPNGWLCSSWDAEERIEGVWFISETYVYVHPYFITN